MSKCSLQLFVNENFTFSKPSLESSDDFLKNLNINRNVFQIDSVPLYKNCSTQPIESEGSKVNQPILKDYLIRHSGSVKAYHKIIQQQEEILNLCRQKLGRKISQSYTSGVKDEDIIRALKIIQESKLKINERCTSDGAIRKILRAIISDDNESSNFEQNECVSEVLKNCSDSSSAKSRKRYSLIDIVNKLRALFNKPVASNYSSLTNQVSKVIISTNKTSEKKEEIYFKLNTVDPPLGMGSKPTCPCHRNLVKLQNEFVKQQSEIRLINRNLQQCLCILHDIGGKPQTTKSKPFKNFFANTNFHAFHVTTEHGYGDHHTPTKKKKDKKKEKKGCCGRKKKKGCSKECLYQVKSKPRHKKHKPKKKRHSQHSIRSEDIEHDGSTNSELHTHHHPVYHSHHHTTHHPKRTKSKQKRPFCGCCHCNKSSSFSEDTASSPPSSDELEHSHHKRKAKRKKKPMTHHKKAKRKEKVKKTKSRLECAEDCGGLHYNQERLAVQNTISVQTMPFHRHKHLSDILHIHPHETIIHPHVEKVEEVCEPKIDSAPQPPEEEEEEVSNNLLPPGTIELPCILCTKETKSAKCYCKDCNPTRSDADKSRMISSSSSEKSVTSNTKSKKEKKSIWWRKKGSVKDKKPKIKKGKKEKKEKKEKKAKKKKEKPNKKAVGGKKGNEVSPGQEDKKKQKRSLLKMCRMICCRGT